MQSALTIGVFMGEKRGAPPPVVRASACLWLANAVIFGIVPLITMGSQLLGGILLWGGIALALTLTALLSWAAGELLQGAGRARRLLTGVAVLLTVSVPLGGPAPTGLMITGLILTLAAAVLMWLPASREYFRGISAPAAA